MEWKDKGNKAFTAHKLTEAIFCYTKAIECDPQNYLYYSNRSTAYFNHKDYKNSLADAEKSIILNTDWIKGYFRKAESLVQLGRLKEATLALERAYQLESSNDAVIELLEKTNKAYIGIILYFFLFCKFFYEILINDQ